MYRGKEKEEVLINGEMKIFDMYSTYPVHESKDKMYLDYHNSKYEFVGKAKSYFLDSVETDFKSGEKVSEYYIYVLKNPILTDSL